VVTLLNKAIKSLKIHLKESYMIGSRSIDIQAGLRVECRTIFTNHNYSEPKPFNKKKM